MWEKRKENGDSGTRSCEGGSFLSLLVRLPMGRVSYDTNGAGLPAKACTEAPVFCQKRQGSFPLGEEAAELHSTPAWPPQAPR